MNLYIESAKALNAVKQKKSSVKTLVYSSQYDNKKQLLALVCETLKYSSYLSTIVKNLQLLKVEHLLKNDSCLAESLLYDFVIGKGLIRAGRLKQTMTRHKIAINTEYKKLCDEAGVSSLREIIEEQETCLPRYVRVNLIKTTVEDVIQILESEEWEYVLSPATHMKRFRKVVRNLEKHQFTRDLHLPDLLVFPPGTDFHEHELFLKGEIILQDKASCFPAHVLNPPEDATVIDCCAAPGNKTSHLASLMKNHGCIYAFDKDGRRLAVLQNLINISGVKSVTTRCQDFLRVRTGDDVYADVEYILVDPSCSGSGIVSRLNKFTDDDDSVATDRLDSLSKFQSTILEHALGFPNVKKVVYSTCSIHVQENEEVVENVFQKVKDEFEFSNIMPDWPERGMSGYEHAQYFMRMSPDSSLTNGFFIACFERKSNSYESDIGNSRSCDQEQDEVETKGSNSEKLKKTKKVNKSECENNDEQENLQYKKETNKDKALDIEHSSQIEVSSESCDNGKKKHKKKKKHRDCDNEAENNNNHQNDVNVDIKDELVKKHKKKKKHRDCDNEEENDVNVDEVLNVKKHKKSKHKKKKLSKTDDEMENGDFSENTSDKSKKKHKRKHKEADEMEEIVDQSPPKKKKKKKKDCD